MVQGQSPERVLTTIVEDPPTGIVHVPQARTWAEAHADPGSTIEAAVLNGWTVVVEPFGILVSLPQVITKLSVGSRVVAIGSTVNADTSFYWAIDGEMVRAFDPLLYDAVVGWATGSPLLEEAGLPFVDHAMASAMACAERLTGVRLTLDWIERRQKWIAVGHPSDRTRHRDEPLHRSTIRTAMSCLSGAA